jgi:hypothetical protein
LTELIKKLEKEEQGVNFGNENSPIRRKNIATLMKMKGENENSRTRAKTKIGDLSL